MGKIEYIVFKEESLCEKARKIASVTDTLCVSEKDFLFKNEKDKYYFYLSENNTFIKKTGSKENGISADFFSGDNYRRVKTKSYKNPLARALGIKGGECKKPFILDATAGLGRDSFFLYSLGAKVAGFERNSFLYFLLAGSLETYLKKNPNEKNNLCFFNFDSGKFFMKNNLFNDYEKQTEQRFYDFCNGETPDVVYFDPMYPNVRKKSAKPKKEMIYLRNLNGDDLDSDLALTSFLENNLRVVVKRPVFAEPVNILTKPSHQIETKLVRYDVYI